MAYIHWDMENQQTHVHIAPWALDGKQARGLQNYLDTERRARLAPRVIVEDLEPLIDEWGPPGVEGIMPSQPAPHASSSANGLLPPPPWKTPDKPKFGDFLRTEKGKQGKGKGKEKGKKGKRY